MNKIIRIGTVACGRRNSSIYCKVEDNGRYISFTGVIGPRPSGNADGGCGQIDMEFAHADSSQDDKRYVNPIRPEEIHFAKGWNKEIWFQFLNLWKKWHLKETMPERSKEWIIDLPDADRKPAWV